MIGSCGLFTIIFSFQLFYNYYISSSLKTNLPNNSEHFIGSFTSTLEKTQDKIITVYCNTQIMSQPLKAQEIISPEKKEQIKQVLPVTNPVLKQINEKYVGKISKGEINVGLLEKSRTRETPDELYDHQIKEKKLSQAKKQKQSLQKKLQFLNKSIQSIQQYDFATASHIVNNETGKNVKLSDPKQFVEKNKQFHEKIKDQKRKLQQKKLLEKKRREQKQKQEQQEHLKREEQEKIKKKQEILESMQKIKQRMEQRQEKIKSNQEQYYRTKNKTTLFKKLEDKYAQQQASLLEQRKKKLANLRNLHKPVSISQIQQHQRKFLQVLKEKQSLRERQRRLSNVTQDYRVSYKSPRHKQFYLDRQSDETQTSKVKAQKIKQFSQHVRQNFVPQIDESKRQSLQKQLQKQKEKLRRKETKDQEERQRVEEIKSKGLRYLQEVKDLPKNRNANSSMHVTERIHYKNYLTHTERTSGKNWGSILSSSGEKRDKAIKLQMEAERIEQSLKLREQKVKILKGNPDEVDQQYFEMIKAKLDLLQI